MSIAAAAWQLSHPLQSPLLGCQQNWWMPQLHLTLAAQVPDLQTSGASSLLWKTFCSDTLSAHGTQNQYKSKMTTHNSDDEDGGYTQTHTHTLEIFNS